MGQPADSAEDGVRKDAQHHRPHPADAIAKPAEQHAAGCRADEEAGRDDGDPPAELHVVGIAEQIAQSRPCDQGKQAHFQAVEHPPEQGGQEGNPATASCK